MPLKLEQRSGGLVLNVKVVPGASRDRIAGSYADGIKVTVAQPPQGGAANAAVIGVIADALSIPKACIQIIRGHTRPRKQLLITGLSAEQVEKRIGSGDSWPNGRISE